MNMIMILDLKKFSRAHSFRRYCLLYVAKIIYIYKIHEAYLVLGRRVGVRASSCTLGTTMVESVKTNKTGLPVVHGDQPPVVLPFLLEALARSTRSALSHSTAR